MLLSGLVSLCVRTILVMMENSVLDSDFDNNRLIEDSEIPSEIPEHDELRSVPAEVPARPRQFPYARTRQGRYISGIVATTSLGSFLWGYNFSIVSGAMLLIDDHFNLSVLWHETIVSVLVCGGTVGAAIAGTLNDKFGRWKVMMMSAILHVVAAVVMALAFSKILLVIGQVIAGLSIGMG